LRSFCSLPDSLTLRGGAARAARARSSVSATFIYVIADVNELWMKKSVCQEYDHLSPVFSPTAWKLSTGIRVISSLCRTARSGIPQVLLDLETSPRVAMAYCKQVIYVVIRKNASVHGDGAGSCAPCQCNKDLQMSMSVSI
jgi:hypothetical protein